MITFFNKTIAQRTPPGQRQSVQNEGMALSNTLVELNLPAPLLCRILCPCIHAG
jgi:hypothetical protein